MRKLKLDLEALAVEGFETATGVQGMEDWPTLVATCPDTCVRSCYCAPAPTINSCFEGCTQWATCATNTGTSL